MRICFTSNNKTKKFGLMEKCLVEYTCTCYITGFVKYEETLLKSIFQDGLHVYIFLQFMV